MGCQAKVALAFTFALNIGVISSLFFCNLHVVIDTPLFAHWQQDIANVTRAVTEITEDLNIIYNNHGFGIQFQVGKITVGRDVCSASSCPDISSLLNSFSEFANSSEYCLHYLFTYRDFASGTVGLAWKGVTCRDLDHTKLVGDLIRNTGLVSFLNFGKTQTLLQVADSLAHEIGHNLGALHDSVTKDCKSETSSIMAETGLALVEQNQINSRKFSTCSKECIQATVKAIFSSGKASSRHCEATGPLTYALKRTMCFDTNQISQPILDYQSGRGWLVALILSLVVTGLFVIMLVICYFVMKRKTQAKYVSTPSKEERMTPIPLAGRAAPALPAYRTAPPPSTRAAPPPPQAAYRVQLPSPSHSTYGNNWIA
eukprot:GFUD01013596.1.p1 GENE.GFUD01013596.1~~GFUD01013596.1.p1  ORF type:complete len:371 (-),score=81.55 GFUD01013596.1:71-1183(-)